MTEYHKVYDCCAMAISLECSGNYPKWLCWIVLAAIRVSFLALFLIIVKSTYAVGESKGLQAVPYFHHFIVRSQEALKPLCLRIPA